MSIYDDDYLDDILRGLSMSDEHKHNVRKLQKRFNLPDDDILFLYLASLEYTVKLCEDILKGISTERQAVEQSAKDVQAAGKEQAEAIIIQMVEAVKVVIAKFQETGMAATSAIAEANSSVLSKSWETVREAQVLKDQITDLHTKVNADRQTNIDVLEVLLKRIGQSTKGLETANAQINGANAAITRLQHNITWIKFAEWFSPLAALVIVLLIGAGGSWWVMSLKYNDSINVLGRDLVNWNADRILKCRKDNNPKCTIWIEPPPEQRK